MIRFINWCFNNAGTVIAGAIVLFAVGLWALYNTPIDLIPDVSEKQVIVLSEWEGRSPAEMDRYVTYQTSRALQGIPNVKKVRASSGFGFSMISVIFSDSTDLYFARTRVSEKLSQITSYIPPGVKQSIGPDATGLGQVLMYTVEDSSGRYNPGELRTINDYLVKYPIQAVSGVSEVATVGGYIQQYNIYIDIYKLRSYRLSISDVLNAVNKSGSNVSSKVLTENGGELAIRGIGILRSSQDIESIVVTTIGSTPIRLSQIAKVELGEQFRRGLMDKNGSETVAGIVTMRYGENPTRVIERVKDKIASIKGSLPEGVSVNVYYDRSEVIKSSVNSLRDTLIEEAAIVGIVIFVFLGAVRPTLVILFSIPVAIAISFIALYYLRVSSNIMSLVGIAISIGVVVDASIVIIENLYKKGAEEAHKALSAWELVRESSLEVAKPIFFSIAIIIISFLPILLLQNVEGKLFYPLVITKTLILSVAMVVSISLVPILLAYILGNKGTHRVIESEFSYKLAKKIHSVYNKIIIAGFRNIGILIISVIIIIAVSVFAYTRTGSEFMPPLDEGSIMYMPTMLPNISIQEAGRLISMQNKIIKTIPEVEVAVGKVGRADTALDPAPVNMIETIIILKSKDKWRAGITKSDIIKEMNTRLSVIPGVAPMTTQPIRGRIDMLSTGIRSQVGLKIFGDDVDTLQKLLDEASLELSQINGITDIYADNFYGSQYLNIDYDREMVARYGVSLSDAQETAALALGGVNADTLVYSGLYRYPIQLKIDPALVPDVYHVSSLPVVTTNSGVIPLSKLAKISVEEGPSMINSEDTRLVGVVQFNVRGRDVGSAISEADFVLSKSVILPTGYYRSWAGEYENQQRTARSLMIIIPVVILLILWLLYAVFHSLRDGILVIAMLPFAVSGGIIGLWLTGANFSTATAIGFVALIGIATQNGVILIYKIRSNMQYTSNVLSAIIRGAASRVRPVLMTATITAFSLLPLLLSHGVGVEVGRSMAIVMFGGIFSAMVLTLVLLPIVYYYVYRRFN